VRGSKEGQERLGISDENLFQGFRIETSVTVKT
jgi:hypothetical protein